MRTSQLDRALANLRAEREVLDLAIRKLEAQIVTKAEKPAKPKRTRKRDQGEGATTDSGNMN